MPITIPAGWPRYPMWENDLPTVDDQLRQGDLLAQVQMPAVQLPLSTYANPLGDSTLGALAVPTHVGLVVSQCCQNEKGKFASISPVTDSRPVFESELQSWLSVEPVGEVELVFDLFCLEERPELIEHRPIRVKSGQEAIKLRVADLARATPYSGDWGELRKQRVARMTPYGRYMLRAKLGFFWSRAEAEDAVALAKLPAS